jgi:hypothetical protein
MLIAPSSTALLGRGNRTSCRALVLEISTSMLRLRPDDRQSVMTPAATSRASNMCRAVLQEIMSNISGSAAMHAALRFVVVSDIPSDHKRVLIDVLTHAVREQDAADLRLKNADQTPQPWSPEDVTRLESVLEHKVARSWQHADEILMGIAAQLHRNPRDVRAKATELGLGHAVDYAIAKTRIVAKEE